MKSVIVGILFTIVLFSCNKSETAPVASAPEACKGHEAIPLSICEDNGACPIGGENESDVISLEPCPNQVIPPGWECDSKECWPTEPEEIVPARHSHVRINVPDQPMLKAEASGMMFQYWVEVPEDKKKEDPTFEDGVRGVIKMAPVAKAEELRHFIATQAVKELKLLKCRYIKDGHTPAVTYWDAELHYTIGVSAMNGVYPVLEGSTQAVVKTLLPVEGGYVEAYLESSSLTDSIEQAVDYERNKGIFDSTTPELCPTKWPHAHHWPLHL